MSTALTQAPTARRSVGRKLKLIGATGMVIGAALTIFGAAHGTTAAWTPGPVALPNANVGALMNQFDTAPAATTAEICKGWASNPKLAAQDAVGIYATTTIPGLTLDEAGLVLHNYCTGY